VNVSLLVFNLLPAFPMDGGRILRAALALRHDYLRATQLAAGAGRVFAVLFGLIGFLYNPFLVLIAAFVWIGASAEAAETLERTLLSGVSVDRVLIRDIRTVDPADTLQMVLGYDLGGFQHDFPVVHEGAVVGLLTHAGLLQGLAEHGPDSPVERSMDRSFQAVEPEEPAARARARLRSRASRSLLVVHDGRLCGMLTADSLNEFVMIQTALRAARRPPAGRRPLRANT
jgi:CBS domain-containing protein